MFSSDKFRKLDDLAGRFAGSRLFWGSNWSDKSSDSDAKRDVKDEMITVEQALAGTVIALPAGKYYQIARGLRTAWPESGEMLRLFHEVFRGAGQRLGRRDAGEELNALADADPTGITYLDIETCGFSGTTVFLIGWGYFDGENDLIVEQALARDYSEEAGILAAVAERLTRTGVLVTYNGKRFDMPSLQERAVIHRVHLPPMPLHVDLLDHTRLRWRKYLPNCQLQTVELHLCRRTRRGDVNGQDIPQAYHDFVKTSDARTLKRIVHHNFIDIVTLAEITIRMLAGQEPE